MLNWSCERALSDGDQWKLWYSVPSIGSIGLGRVGLPALGGGRLSSDWFCALDCCPGNCLRFLGICLGMSDCIKACLGLD